MNKLARVIIILLLAAGAILAKGLGASPSVLAAGATSEIRIARYAVDRTTVISEKSVSYQWMKDNLPVHGDGKTHYYHQGPVFEGDMWDPSETTNLKDKGALMGANSRDLCALVGGMAPGDEISFVSVDGWHADFAYENIYQPLERQGPIVLAWYNGEDSTTGEKSGRGYPGVDGFHTAIQIIVMASTTNAEGKHVFGNDDMRVCLPQEKYHHYYEGLPSTNGLSGKWISELRIYSQTEAPASAAAQPAGSDRAPAATEAPANPQTPQAQPSGALAPVLWVALGVGGIGLALIGVAFARLRREKH